MVSLFASAVRAIDNTALLTAKDFSESVGPTHAWDEAHSWILFCADKVNGEEVYWETRAELRPFVDIPIGSEEDAAVISIAVRAKAWIPGDSQATWSRVVSSATWSAQDFLDRTDEQVQNSIEQWLKPAWDSAMKATKGQIANLSAVADQRRNVMESPWPT